MFKVTKESERVRRVLEGQEVNVRESHYKLVFVDTDRWGANRNILIGELTETDLLSLKREIEKALGY